MPFPLLAAALPATLSAAGAVGSALLGNSMQRKADDRAHQRNLDYYNMQRQDALNDWRMQNEYNSPVEQMNRLRQAGISPYAQNAMQYAGGNQNSVRPSQQGNLSYQVNAPRNLFENIQMLQNVKASNAQIRKTDAETKAIELQYSVDNNTKLPLIMAQLEDTRQSAELKAQTVQNAKQTLQGMLQEQQMKATEQIYQNAFLSGRNDLQQKMLKNLQIQSEKLLQEIQGITFTNQKNVKLLPFEIRKIAAEIESLMTASRKTSYYGLDVDIQKGIDNIRTLGKNVMSGNYQGAINTFKNIYKK